jgi:hypothetical protein
MAALHLELRRTALIHLKPVCLDWSRPARDFIHDKLREVFRRPALGRDVRNADVVHSALNCRVSIAWFVCVVELFDATEGTISHLAVLRCGISNRPMSAGGHLSASLTLSTSTRYQAQVTQPRWKKANPQKRLHRVASWPELLIPGTSASASRPNCVFRTSTALRRASGYIESGSSSEEAQGQYQSEDARR